LGPDELLREDRAAGDFFEDLMIPKLAKLRFISQREDLCAQVGGRLEHFHFYSEQSS
jgi:hypothetical protein